MTKPVAEADAAAEYEAEQAAAEAARRQKGAASGAGISTITDNPVRH
ncbi:hypothetical protein ACFWWS_37600 [Streptomyces sp. NPDC059083]